MTKKPLILVTNDDGITAPGIRTLIKIMNSIGEVIVVAPDSPIFYHPFYVNHVNV